MGIHRQYKTPRLDPRTKEGRAEKEKETRNRNKARLSETEKILYVGIKRYGKDLLEATGRGLTLDESKYARAIRRVLQVNNVLG